MRATNWFTKGSAVTTTSAHYFRNNYSAGESKMGCHNYQANRNSKYFGVS